MKTFKNSIGSYGLAVLAMAFTVLVFAACKKNNDFVNNNMPAAGVMAFNLSADAPAVGFTFNGNGLSNAPIGYSNFTGVYLPVTPGSKEVRSVEFYSGSTIAISNNNFADSMYYSTFLLGANGNYRNLVVKDEAESLTPATGKAWVRYINAIPDSSATPVVTIGGTVENAAYATISPFRQVNAGQLATSISNGGSINANRTITIEENRIYTILMIGLPNTTDPAKAIQIRFVQNGTATD